MIPPLVAPIAPDPTDASLATPSTAAGSFANFLAAALAVNESVADAPAPTDGFDVVPTAADGGDLGDEAAEAAEVAVAVDARSALPTVAEDLTVEDDQPDDDGATDGATVETIADAAIGRVVRPSSPSTAHTSIDAFATTSSHPDAAIGHVVALAPDTGGVAVPVGGHDSARSEQVEPAALRPGAIPTTGQRTLGSARVENPGPTDEGAAVDLPDVPAMARDARRPTADVGDVAAAGSDVDSAAGVVQLLGRMAPAAVTGRTAAAPVMSAGSTLAGSDTVRYLRELGPARAVQRLAVDLDGTTVSVRIDSGGLSPSVHVQVLDDPGGRLGATWSAGVERTLTHAMSNPDSRFGGQSPDDRQRRQHQDSPDDPPTSQASRRWSLALDESNGR